MALVMQGGMKVYAGVAAAARHYVEADRGRADDYYLAEGTGVAQRFTATEGQVRELAPLTGDSYEAWVAGRPGSFTGVTGSSCGLQPCHFDHRLPFVGRSAADCRVGGAGFHGPDGLLS